MKHTIWQSFRARFYGNNFLLAITAVLFVALYIAEMIVFKGINYDKLQHFLDMLNSNAGLIVIAAGMTMILIIGGIDISVGSQVAMYCMMLAVMMERGNFPFIAAVSIVFLTGIVFGFVQGWFISFLKLQPFIVTLAGMFFARGMTAVITADTISIRNADFAALANAKIILPFGGYLNKKGFLLEPFIHPNVVFAIVGLIIIYILMSRTRFGRNVYAVGGSEQSATLMGLNVRRTKLIAYTLNGFVAAFGGFLFCLNSSAGNVEQARGFEMNAIAASVIGGTPLTGGVGNVIGSFIGVMIQETINSFVRAMSMSSWWAMIFIAALLAVFIILQSLIANSPRS